MKLNKKLIGLMLALTIGGALVGCSSGNNQAEDNNEQILQEQEDAKEGLDEIENQETTEENQTDEVKDETKEDEVKDEAKDEIKEDTAKEENKAESVKPETTKPEATKPTETTPVQKPESKPETSKPETSKPETKPEVTAMSAQELMGKVITESMELPMLNQMDSTYFADTYGIDTSLLKSYEVRMPVMIVHSSEIGIFELNNASDAQKVIAGIEKRVEGLKNQWQSYLPDQYELVQNYKTATKGNYVIFVVSEYADTIISNFNAQVK